jgi:hypothetical protein
MIPVLGPLGAALVTAICSCLGALANILAVYRGWRIIPSWNTIVRSILIFSAACGLAAFWPAAGVFLLVKLLVIGSLILLGFYLSGEFTAGEISYVVSLLPGRGRD